MMTTIQDNDGESLTELKLEECVESGMRIVPPVRGEQGTKVAEASSSPLAGMGA